MRIRCGETGCERINGTLVLGLISARVNHTVEFPCKGSATRPCPLPVGLVVRSIRSRNVHTQIAGTMTFPAAEMSRSRVPLVSYVPRGGVQISGRDRMLELYLCLCKKVYCNVRGITCKGWRHRRNYPETKSFAENSANRKLCAPTLSPACVRATQPGHVFEAVPRDRLGKTRGN
jgi:hypothetical protein